MTDLLLIQPPIRDFYLTAKRSLPLGLASIAGAVQAEGFSVSIFDALATHKKKTLPLPPEMGYLSGYYGAPDRSPFALFSRYRHFGYSFEHIGRIARESRAFLVGIASLFTPYCQEALETARTVRRFLPQAAIVLGGHHPTALPEAAMDCQAVDYLIRGEGELGLPALAKALRDGSSLADVPGISFRKANGRLHINPPAVMADPDRYPAPALELVSERFYRRKGKASLVVLSSRGCPFACSYCCVGRNPAMPYRRRRPESVLAEIDRAAKTGEPGFIDFEDENLALDKSGFLRLLEGIYQRFGGRVELRAMNGLFPPALDETVLAAMKKAGFRTLNLSLGSASRDQLKRFGRPDVRKALRHILWLAPRYGLSAVTYLIVGAPDQSPQSSLNDLLFLAKLPSLVGLSVFYPAPWSADYQHCEQAGLLPPAFSLMRATALPLAAHRLETVTLLRLGRILNFIKFLSDLKEPLPPPCPLNKAALLEADRIQAGKALLAAFFHDGIIRGIGPDGQVFAHASDASLCRGFLRFQPGHEWPG